MFFSSGPQHLNDSSYQQRASPDPPANSFHERWPPNGRPNYPHDDIPQPRGLNERLPPHPFDDRDQVDFPPPHPHREFPPHSFNDNVHDEFHQGSPRERLFEGRNIDEFQQRPPPPPPHHHHDFDDRDFPADNFHPQQQRPYRPPLLPLPHRQPDFNDMGNPQEFVVNMGPPRPLPPLQKPEIKTVPAEKIFDLPGRTERPTHVSGDKCVCECVSVCVCVCVCVWEQEMF